MLLTEEGGEWMFTFREWRRAKGVSIREIAAELGVNPSTIIKWENGTSKMPVDKAALYCQYLGIGLDDVIILPKGAT